MNFIQFFSNFKININDVTKGFFNGEFSPFFKHKKGNQHEQRIFLIFLIHIFNKIITF